MGREKDSWQPAAGSKQNSEVAGVRDQRTDDSKSIRKLGNSLRCRRLRLNGDRYIAKSSH